MVRIGLDKIWGSNGPSGLIFLLLKSKGVKKKIGAALCGEPQFA